LLLAGCDGLIISDAGPQSKGVVSWPVSQKMPAWLRQGGTKKKYGGGGSKDNSGVNIID
jgi:hypothetical protein